MQYKTIKLNKRDRLEIKKKLSILMVKQFSLIKDSSPDCGQMSRARVRRDPFARREILIPFPYCFYESPMRINGTTQSIYSGLPSNSTIFSYEVVAGRSRRISNNSRIPRRKFSFGNIRDGMFTCASYEKYLTIYMDDRCSITVGLGGKLSTEPAGWPTRKTVRITYSRRTKRLHLSTDIENYSDDEMVNFIRNVLFEYFVY